MTIALVGKYTDLKDSYMSVMKALEHSAFRIHRKLIIQVSGSIQAPLLVLMNCYLTWPLVVGRVDGPGAGDAGKQPREIS